jgi:hypothetical protein
VLQLQGIQFIPYLSNFCCLSFNLLLPRLQLLELILHDPQFVWLDAWPIGHGLLDIWKKFEKEDYSTKENVESSRY